MFRSRFDTAGSVAIRSAALLVMLSAGALACDSDDRPRHPARHGDDPELGSDGDGGVEAGANQPLIPPETNPAITQDPPRLESTSVCQGTRVYEVRRHHTGAPANAPPLKSRFFGRNEFGQYLTFKEVLLCELRTFNWIIKPRDEPQNLVLWRGPYIFEPDSDCDWREPMHSEPFPGGRRLYLHEHCRSRARPGPADREVIVEVSADYAQMTVR